MRNREIDYGFALWMAAQPLTGAMVTPEIVAGQFSVSRATSYRWLRSFRIALRTARAA